MSSEIKANKISPATGTAFTLGDSGDTFTVPSGATLSGAGAITVPSGGSLTIDSGATVTNNGTVSGFGGSNTAFSATRAGGYFSTGIGDNSWTKSPIGSYNSWGGSIPVDTASGFDQTNSRWTCPSGEAGVYLVGFWLKTHNNGAQVRSERWRPYINGSTAGVEDNLNFSDVVGRTGSMQMIELSVGDYVEWWFLADWDSSVRLTGCAQWGFKLI